MTMDAPSTEPTAAPRVWTSVFAERFFLLGATMLLCGVAGALLGVLSGALIGWQWINAPELGQGVIQGVRLGFLWGGSLGALSGFAWSWSMRLNPLTLRKIKRFTSIRRGYWSFLLLGAAFLMALAGEAFVNNQALIVKYKGHYHFPFLPGAQSRKGQDYGLSRDRDGQKYSYPVNYRELQDHFQHEGKGNWVLMPIVPYDPYEIDSRPFEGRFVRVTAPGKDRQLTLTKVEVIRQGEPLLGKAKQSSTMVGRSAEAVFQEGNTTWLAGGAQTKESADPWWEMDLEKPRTAVDVIIVTLPVGPAEDNRTLPFEKAMTQLTVELLDENRKPVWQKDYDLGQSGDGRVLREVLLTHPRAPDTGRLHLLGTDATGRDVLARLFYGFRITMLIALTFMLMVYLIGVAIGCTMGYFGGWVDLAGQRGVEIWQNIPFLYMVIIVVAVVSDLPFTPPIWFKIATLLAVLVFFSWTTMTYYMRTAVYREKARDYVAAAQLLGASTPRVLFNHLMPNTISTMVTFMPFTVSTAIISVTALDYLNFGLPKPTPSWGELLKQGVDQLHAPWIVLSAFFAMATVLVLVTFIGEAIREAFDPKKFTTYE